MTQLQKRLEELESELAVVFRFPPETTPGLRQQISFEDVEPRFDFLRRLLAAEFNSQPQNAGELHETAERLTALEANFREWNESRIAAFNDCNNHDDALSICSDCTQTLFHNDGDGKESDSTVSVPENFFSPEKFKISALNNCNPDATRSDLTQTFHFDDDEEWESDSSVSETGNVFSPEKLSLVSDGENNEGNMKKEEIKGGRVWGRISKCCGVFGSGMIFGVLICMMKFLTSPNFSTEHELLYLHPPPT